jgi:hypothetical protein
MVLHLPYKDDSDMFRKFSQWFDTPSAKGNSLLRGERPCNHGGCQDEGIYRAPKSRYHLESGVDDWYWFCLIHIRDYNAKWSYYDNMSEPEIERERRADVTWQRPTWPLGSSSGAPTGSMKQPLQDPLGLFTDFSSFYTERFGPDTPEGKALKILELSYPFSHEELRKTYRTLVKKHHPDTNPGRLEAVELLKRINEAYRILKALC